MMSKTQGGNDDKTYGRRYPEDLVERFSIPSMGEAAERIADRWNLDRVYLDELALRSHALASEAVRSGRFDRAMVPLRATDGTTITHDEGVRSDGSLEKLATLRAPFRKWAYHRRQRQPGF